MKELTPEERIDLKVDSWRALQLERMRRPMSGRASHTLEAPDRLCIEETLDRYPVLVELVRRLTEEAA